MKFWLFLLSFLLFAANGTAQPFLSESNFISRTGDVAGWKFHPAGNGQSVYLHHPGQPAALLSPSAKSWGFLQTNFDWKDTKTCRIRASAWIFSNVPEKTAIIISDGAGWGDACPRVAIAGGIPGTANSWQRISVEQDIQTGGIVSVAIGYDYQAPGAWCLIADAIVEEMTPGTQPVNSQPPQTPGAIPAEFSAVLNGTDFFQIAAVPELTAYRANTPINGPAPETVSLIAPIGGYAESLLLLRNPSHEVQSFQVRFSGDEILNSRITLYRYHYEDGSPDRPLQLDKNGLMEIGREQTVGLNLQLNTHNLPAGNYRGVLKVVPQSVIVPVYEIPYNFTVVPVKLPKRVEKTMIFNWDYSAAKSLKELDFLLDGRVNTFSVAPVDLNILEKIVSNLRKRGFKPGDYTLFLEDWHLREKNSFEENDKAWLDAIVSKTQELGLGYHDWYLHIYDEVFSDDFFAVAQAIKQHNPSVRIFSDHIGEVDKLQRFSQVVDAWSPLEGTLPPFASYAAAWDFMRASGKPLYIYCCDSVAGLAPDNYRLMPYLAYLENLNGFSYWSVLSSPDRAHPGKERWGITYLDAGQHRQPSRRWWQWRSGIEDYLLLQMVEKAFGRLRAENIASKVRDAWNTNTFAKTVAQARMEMLQLLSAEK